MNSGKMVPPRVGEGNYTRDEKFRVGEKSVLTESVFNTKSVILLHLTSSRVHSISPEMPLTLMSGIISPFSHVGVPTGIMPEMKRSAR